MCCLHQLKATISLLGLCGLVEGLSTGVCGVFGRSKIGGTYAGVGDA